MNKLTQTKLVIQVSHRERVFFCKKCCTFEWLTALCRAVYWLFHFFFFALVNESNLIWFHSEILLLSSCGCSVLTYTAYAVVFIMHYSVHVVSLTHCSISICAMSFSTMRLYHYIVPYVKHSFFMLCLLLGTCWLDTVIQSLAVLVFTYVGSRLFQSLLSYEHCHCHQCCAILDHLLEKQICLLYWDDTWHRSWRVILRFS